MGRLRAILVNDETFDAVVERLRAGASIIGRIPSSGIRARSTPTTVAAGLLPGPVGHYLEALTARYDGSALT